MAKGNTGKPQLPLWLCERRAKPLSTLVTRCLLCLLPWMKEEGDTSRLCLWEIYDLVWEREVRYSNTPTNRYGVTDSATGQSIQQERLSWLGGDT